MTTRPVQKGDGGQVNPDGRQAEVGAEVGREQGYMTPGGWDCGHLQMSAECDTTPNPNLVCGSGRPSQCLADQRRKVPV